MQENYYSINFAQRLHGPNEQDGYYHAFASLMPSGAVVDAFCTGAQKLHFNDDIWGRMSPILREGCSPRWQEGLDLDPYCEGDEISVLPRWNHGLQYAVDVREKYAVSFDKRGTNCLSGAKKAIEVMGFDFRDEFSKSAVGLGANELPSANPFVFDARNPEHTDLETMRALNKSLVARLPTGEYKR